MGGGVSGDSDFAGLVRVAMRTAKSKSGVSSGYGPQPHSVALDVNTPHLMDSYLRSHFDEMPIISGPNVEYPKTAPRPAPPPGCVY